MGRAASGGADRTGVLAGSGLVWLGLVSAATGASALILQVTWHRVIALHAGIDLAASTTVVAAFLAGLGLGNLLGGRVADRLGPAGALRALAASNAGLAAYALASVPLLYDVYRDVAATFSSTAATFAFNAVVLLPATLLLGVSLPLVARAVTPRIADAGRLVGRFNAVNTLGASVGAMVGGWVLIGEYGYVAVTRMCAGVHAVAAVGLILLAATARPVAAPAEPPTAASMPRGDGPEHPPWAPWRWYLVYALVGAVALGFEQVFFRLVDGVMRSNSYSFAHVLGLYLGLWAAGAATGSVLVRRARDPRRWFLWMQFGIGLGGLAAMITLVHVVPHTPLGSVFEDWFRTEGMAYSLADPGDRLLFGLVVPSALMAVPVLLFGAAFPFAEALASRDLAHVGRTTGRLLGANLAGNVAGAVVTSFVLIEHLGAAGSVVALSLPMLAAGLVAAGLAPPGRVVVQRVVVALVAVLAVAAAPSTGRLWATLTASPRSALMVAEDRSCASVVRLDPSGPGAMLVLNGRPQNGYPFDDFHVMVGLLPVLAHPDPEEGLAIGFGIGSTSYAMLASDRLDAVTSVEICPGNYALARGLARRGDPEFRRLVEDPAHTARTGDGRKLLLTTSAVYDVIVPDTLVPNSPGSTNVYSKEFFDLASSRLARDGLLAIWSASPRVAAAAAATFPYVVRVDGDTSAYPSKILLASRSPIDLTPRRLLERFDEVPAPALRPPQRSVLRGLLADLVVECFTDGRVAPSPAPETLNRDLRPRDEFFVNGRAIGEDAVSRTCGP